MTDTGPDPDDSASAARMYMIRAAAQRLTDPALRRLLEQVAEGALSATDAIWSALEHVDRHRQGGNGPVYVHRALSLADAALGADGLQVDEPAVRELGRRVAEGRMTGDEAGALIHALLPFGVVSTQMQTPVPTLDDRVGPFFDTTSLRRFIRSSAEALATAVVNGDVLAVVSADGFLLYPAFQFNESGEPLPRLRDVLAELDPELVDPWGDAVWLNAPGDDLDGLSPAVALREGRAEDVIRLAGQSAFRAE